MTPRKRRRFLRRVQQPATGQLFRVPPRGELQLPTPTVDIRPAPPLESRFVPQYISCNFISGCPLRARPRYDAPEIYRLRNGSTLYEVRDTYAPGAIVYPDGTIYEVGDTRWLFVRDTATGVGGWAYASYFFHAGPPGGPPLTPPTSG